FDDIIEKVASGRSPIFASSGAASPNDERNCGAANCDGPGKRGAGVNKSGECARSRAEQRTAKSIPRNRSANVNESRNRDERHAECRAAKSSRDWQRQRHAECRAAKSRCDWQCRYRAETRCCWTIGLAHATRPATDCRETAGKYVKP